MLLIARDDLIARLPWHAVSDDIDADRCIFGHGDLLGIGTGTEGTGDLAAHGLECRLGGLENFGPSRPSSPVI